MNDKALIPAKSSDLIEINFNKYDFYYAIPGNEYRFCICYKEYLKRKETYFDWFIKVPIKEITNFIELQ